MTTFIISCEGDRESGIKGESAMVSMENINKGNIRKVKKGFAETFQEQWNAGPVRVKQLKEIKSGK